MQSKANGTTPAVETPDVRSISPACFPCRSASTCEAAVVEQGGRWFITMGHPGYNSRANNGCGWTRERDARETVLRNAAKAVRR